MQDIGFDSFHSYLSCFPFLTFASFSSSAKVPYRRSAFRLSKPLIGEDGKIYACSEKTLFAFESNGTIAWSLDLDFTCNIGTAPVHGGTGEVYIVAENRVLKVDLLKIGTSESATQVFYGTGSGKGGTGAIAGIAVSTSSSSVYINVKRRALFAFMTHGQLLWSAGPVLDQLGYRQGCTKTDVDCYFTSVPVIDQCEGSIYISNTQGELYSLSARSPYFNWIQDLSSFDKAFTLTPGNNGYLYVTIPVRALVLALDTSSGNILWHKSVGPLGSAEYAPVVDSNGWISVGSLDGLLYSFSPSGVLNKFSKSDTSDSVIQVSPLLDCSAYAVYISQTEMNQKITCTSGEYTFVSTMNPKSAVFSLLVPSTGAIYWSESYPGQFSSLLSKSDLQHFVLDESLVLAFLTASKTGNPLPCRTKYQKLVASCSQTRPKLPSIYTVLLVLAVLVRFCCIFWRKKKLQGQHLGNFLEKRRSLQLKKKAFDRSITELEKKVAEDAVANEVIKKISSLVRERRSVERKLSTTYSLGRDEAAASSESKSLPPVYDAKSRSYSFQGAKKESVTIFHTLSATSSAESSSERETSWVSEDKDQVVHLMQGIWAVDQGSSYIGYLPFCLYMEAEDVIDLLASSPSGCEEENNEMPGRDGEPGKSDFQPNDSEKKEDDSNGESMELNELNVEIEDGQLIEEGEVGKDVVDDSNVNVEGTTTVELAETIVESDSRIHVQNGCLEVGNRSPNHNRMKDVSSTSGVKRARMTLDEEQPSVHVIYNSLTRASKQKLEELLQQWSEWQAQFGSSSNDPNEGIEFGEQTFFPAIRVGKAKGPAVSFWIDNQTRNQQNKNFIPSDSHSTPLYDRGYALGLTSGDGSSLEIIDDASRCFNCGSYSHSLKECPKPRDKDAVNNARKQHKSKRNQNSASRNPMRYYQNSAGGKYDGLRPGALDAETRQLLGLGELDPPPWLHRMRELGYPPGYLDSEDDDQPSGITIYADREIKEGQEDGEIIETGSPASKRKMTTEFPGINAPIPENADERLWAARPSSSDSSRDRSHHRLNHHSESISRGRYHEQRWSRDYRDDGPPGVDPVSSYPPRYGGYDYYSSHSRSPTRGRSYSDRDRDDYASHGSYSSPYSNRHTSPPDYDLDRYRDDYSREYLSRSMDEYDRFRPRGRWW
ncbi:hypothetical protein CUMW_095280 [Citrus unshiu]|uniref:CCHC-type domain-containing protein n=1 Tax=Citrus unshiu TaxID=55188 RepID=A0A2H5P1G0_CITUN|nr:hypothetical protein CUMW_095280 [Citrus unshiu]